MSFEFVTIDRDTPYLLPPSVQNYLSKDHLARFLAETRSVHCCPVNSMQKGLIPQHFWYNKDHVLHGLD